MKKEIKPDYYDEFTCIADKCSYTCCREWKIAIDKETHAKWDTLHLTEYTEEQEGACQVKLTQQKRCPFLNEQKLCKLVTQYGDNILSTTCKVFPRQVHDFAERTEKSLVACCPEVVDFLNKQQKLRFTVDMETTEDDVLFQIRTMMIGIMQNEDYSITKGLMMNFFMLLDLLEHQERVTHKLKEYEQEEIWQELSKTIDNMDFVSLDTFDENNELFLDLAENYRKQGIYTEYLEEIAQLAEGLSESYEEEQMLESLQVFKQQFSDYERLFQNYIVNELFTNSLLPDSDLESMVVMMQWIAMEYSIIRHSIFLRFLLDDGNKVSYQMVRNYIVTISRMTGYDQEDIYEYLENSFQSLIWEWGYLALIVGACL